MRPEIIRVAVVQARREREWKDSLRRMASIVRKFSPEADILMLGENWLSRDPVPLEDYAYSLEYLSREVSSEILGGANYVTESEGARSVGLAIIGGRVVRACEKLFPSRAVGERGKISPGRLLGPVEVRGWKVQCLVCVDIFYPEPGRLATLRGTDVVYNPASIPSDRTSLWHSVLLARAAENTIYAVGVNGVGNVYPDGRITLGGSAVFAPNGVMLGSMGGQEGVEVFLLDYRVIDRIRERWAFYEDLTGPLARVLYRGLHETLEGKPLLGGEG